MTKLISFLIVNESNIQEATLDLGFKRVISELTDLRYVVKKVTVLESDDRTVQFELEHLLKQNDFVVLIDKRGLKTTYTSVCEIFNTDLVVAHLVHQHKTSAGDLMMPRISKFLHYDNSIRLLPVLYLGRLFVVRSSNIKLTFDHILKPFLKKFNKEGFLVKRLCFKGCEIDISDYQNKCDCVEVLFERKGDLSILEFRSRRLSDVVDYQRTLRKKYGRFLCDDGEYVLESVYEKDCFEHVNRAVQVSFVYRFNSNNAISIFMEYFRQSAFVLLLCR